MITLSVVMSEQCNLNCTYCGVDKLSKKKISPALFLDEFKKKRRDFPNEKFKIDFFGGEPLLQWPMVQEIIEATKHEENLEYFMPTNGLLLNEEKIDYLNKNNVSVSLSFDGLWQDQNRKQHNDKETLPLYIEKKDLFKKIKKRSCHTMIYKGNYNLLENHLFIMRNLDLNPELTLVRDIGVWSKESAEQFNLAFTELVNWYAGNFEHEEMPNLIKHYIGHILRYSSKKIAIDYCGASEDYFAFSENKMVACNRFKEQEMLDKIPDFKKMKACEACSVRNYCTKGCLYENIKNDGIIIELCSMYKHIYKTLVEMIGNLRSSRNFQLKLKELISEC